MSTDTQLIEIKRVLSDKDENSPTFKNNTGSALETIEADRIRSFRRWHKGKKDVAIEGDMTLLIMKPDVHNPKSQNDSILIEESYESFRDRMAVRVPIRKLNASD